MVTKAVEFDFLGNILTFQSVPHTILFYGFRLFSYFYAFPPIHFHCMTKGQHEHSFKRLLLCPKEERVKLVQDHRKVLF